MFNLIEQLFNPSRRHTDEERRRLETTRVDTNDADPGTGPIDLDSGRVCIRLPANPDEDTARREGAEAGLRAEPPRSCDAPPIT
ncbi:DUF6191 domain-containing protein [Streptomyces erythrochromogenes]|uniref:DUF6191 domain-containing protein n=1 Tax=Streptomyces erythrochromogenes TaxID=285574 RepID=UPI003413D4A8